MKKILKSAGTCLPRGWQPKAKEFYFAGQTLLSAMKQRRRILRGFRVVWPGPEVADLQTFSTLSPGPDELLVRSEFTAVSPGTERAFLLGLPGTHRSFPSFPGYSGSGRVVSAGKKIAAFMPGDLVAGRIPHASLAVVKPDYLFPVPKDVSLLEASFLELAIIVLQGVRKAALKPGESVLVLGQGLIGQIANRLARHSGGTPVVASARTGRFAEFSCHSGGADLFLPAEGMEKELQFDVVIEATGDPKAIREACSHACPGGRVVLLGSPRGLTYLDLAREVQARGLILIGAHISSLPLKGGTERLWSYREEGNFFLDLLSQNALLIKDLISHKVDPREADRFYLSLRRGGAGVLGAVFDWAGTNGQKTQRSPERNSPSKAHDPSGPSFVRETRRRVDRKLRIGVVGGGDIGIRNAESVRRTRTAEIACVFDINRKVRRQMAERFSVPGTDSFQEMLSRGDVDAVLLSVPHHLHALMGIAAAEAGKHVLVEKPLGVDLNSSGELLEACRREKVRLSVNFSFRYKPVIQLARDFTAGGMIGELAGIQINHLIAKGASYWAEGYSGRSSDDWRGLKKKAGGGILIMGVCHTIDYLRFITGLEVQAAFGRYGTFASPVEVEDTITATLKYSNGATGSLTASTCWKGNPLREDRLWGTEGQLTLYPDHLEFWSSRRWGKKWPAGRLHRIRRFPNVDYTAEWIERFAGAVLANGPHEITGEDGWINNAVLEAIYSSQEARRFLEVPSLPPAAGAEASTGERRRSDDECTVIRSVSL
jgi:2-desacetyl-2-hydroxyethyl bacteriochlorophyllide A dehydrogenase